MSLAGLRLPSLPTHASPEPAERTRADIQALRAIAVGAVVVGHLWPHLVPNGRAGVDVFFVISGFLITAHLLRRPPVDVATLTEFWARRIRRLLPAATLVLAVTLVAAWIWLPEEMARQSALEAAAASVYAENWVRGATLGGPGGHLQPDSPVQHYWSLSVEEQFYVLWPLLIGAAVLFARRGGVAAAARRAGRVLTAVVLGVVALSFLASVWTTHVDDVMGYFGTHVRIWELAAGGAVALAVGHGRRWSGQPGLRALASWLGLALIAASVLLLTPADPFPGPWALLPVIGAALVIWADSDQLTAGVGRVLSLRAVQYVGDISYSVYLWHWPLIVFVPLALATEPQWPLRFAMGAASLVLGGLTHALVDEKLRHQRGLVATVPRSYALGAICIGLVLLLALALVVHTLA